MILLVGRRDSNPRPSAPKFDSVRNFNNLTGTVGAVSPAEEAIGILTVGLKWVVEKVLTQNNCLKDPSRLFFSPTEQVSYVRKAFDASRRAYLSAEIPAY